LVFIVDCISLYGIFSNVYLFTVSIPHSGNDLVR